MSVVESTVDGRYQVIARVASGGMGEVFRAQDAVLGRDVALKILHPQYAGDRGFVARFRREARAAAVLNHPNIVGVYDWGSTDGTYFMVMEFVRGHNLRSVLLRQGRLEPAQVVEVALPVLAALDHAHGHGIVHRDVKPENILIADDGTVKVADFGLARAFADSHVSQAEGTVTGTVQYLAPEQVQGEPADPRTDLYALGVVMFELLTGAPPYGGETAVAIAYQHLSSQVPAPSSVLPTLEAALDGPVLHA
ncbi:MAG TPA: protein kinase, partial [Actinomycetota bacterium]